MHFMDRAPVVLDPSPRNGANSLSGSTTTRDADVAAVAPEPSPESSPTRGTNERSDLVQPIGGSAETVAVAPNAAPAGTVADAVATEQEVVEKPIDFEGPAFVALYGFFRTRHCPGTAPTPHPSQSDALVEEILSQLHEVDPIGAQLRTTCTLIPDELASVGSEVMCAHEAAQIGPTRTLLPLPSIFDWHPAVPIAYFAVLCGLLCVVVAALYLSLLGTKIVLIVAQAVLILVLLPWIGSMSRFRLRLVFTSPEFLVTAIGFLVSQGGFWFLYIVLDVGWAPVVLGIFASLAMSLGLLAIDAVNIRPGARLGTAAVCVVATLVCFIVGRFSGPWLPARVRHAYETTINFGILEASPQMVITYGFLPLCLYYIKFVLSHLMGKDFYLFAFRTVGLPIAPLKQEAYVAPLDTTVSAAESVETPAPIGAELTVANESEVMPPNPVNDAPVAIVADDPHPSTAAAAPPAEEQFFTAFSLFLQAPSASVGHALLKSLRAKLHQVDPEATTFLSERLVPYPEGPVEIHEPGDLAQMESASVVVNDPRLVTLWASPLFKLYYSNNINLGLGVMLLAFIVPIGGMSPCLLIGQLLVILNSPPWLAVMSKARMIRALKVPDLYVNCFNMLMPHIGYMITYNNIGLNAGYLVLASVFAIVTTVSFIPFDIYQSRFVSNSIKGKVSIVGPPLMLIAWMISRFAEYWYRADVLKVWDEDVNVGFFKTTPRTIACAGHLNNGVFFVKLIFTYLALKRDFIFLNIGRKVAFRGDHSTNPAHGAEHEPPRAAVQAWGPSLVEVE